MKNAFIFCLASLALFSCKPEKQDTVFPIITRFITDKTVYNEHDTIFASMAASDNLQISRMSISLYYYNGNDYDLVSAVFSQGANTSSFSAEIPLNFEDLQPGEYDLRAIADDGTNKTVKTIALRINTIPKQLLGLLLFDNQDDAVVIQYTDTVNVAKLYMELPSKNSKYVFNHSRQQLLISDEASSKITAYSYKDKTPVWSFEYSLSNSVPLHELVFDAGFKRYLMASGDEYLKSIDLSGMPRFSVKPDVSYYPKHLARSGNYLLTYLEQVNTTQNSLVLLGAGNGGLLRKLSNTGDIKKILPVTNGFLYFRENAGQTTLYTYEPERDEFVQRMVLQDIFVKDAKAVTADEFIIKTTDGLYHYRLSNNNLIKISGRTDIGGIAADVLNGTIFYYAGNVIYAVNAQGGLLFSFPVAIPVDDILPMYNKN